MSESNDDLRDRLTPMQFAVTQEAATEPPFTGIYTDHFEPGVYKCVVCAAPLFRTTTKYHSGCGWPSFYEPIDKNAITEKIDTTHGMIRTETVCTNCGAHLGHVFPDGPEPTGVRYCINSASLGFEES